MTPTGNGRRTPVLALLAVLTFAVGYLGQGFWQVGARADPPVVSAIATDVIGGIGTRQPVRIRVTIAVANDGAQEVQVIAPEQPTPGVTVIGLDPGVLTVPAGRVGQLNADVAVHCEQETPLSLPALQIELIDGVRHRLGVSGSGVLLEACARGAPTVRPLIASIPATKAGSSADQQSLTVTLRSPTGRPADVSAIRAGGVGLRTVPAAVSVAGTAPATVRLSAPRSCPLQWQVTGVPSALVFDLAPVPRSESGSVTSLQLKLGPELASWLLATSCSASR
jgi:hypothetical protein